MFGIWDLDEVDWVRVYSTSCIGYEKAILVFEKRGDALEAAAEYFGYTDTNYEQVVEDGWCKIRSIFAPSHQSEDVDLEDGGVG